MAEKPQQLTTGQQNLIDAINRGQENITALIEALPGPELHFRTEDGATPLALAARYGNNHFVVALAAHTRWDHGEVQAAVDDATDYIQETGVDPSQYHDTFMTLEALLTTQQVTAPAGLTAASF